MATADRQVLPNTGRPNPYADRNVPQAEDKSDNAASLSLLIKIIEESPILKEHMLGHTIPINRYFRLNKL